MEYSYTHLGMLSTFFPLQTNLNRERNYNPNVAHCYFMSLGFEQRILGMRVEGKRASSHYRESLNSGLYC